MSDTLGWSVSVHPERKKKKNQTARECGRNPMESEALQLREPWLCAVLPLARGGREGIGRLKKDMGESECDQRR
jgi:hypothetical protein